MERASKLLCCAVLVACALGQCVEATEEELEANDRTSLKLCAFNIQIFGVSKSENLPVLEILSRIVRRYDITLIQEIRDISMTVIYDFLDRVNSDASDAGVRYNMTVSPRLGRSNSREQYAYLYRTDTVNLSMPLLYDDSQDDVFEREPYSILVRSLLTDLPPFFLLGHHADPDDVMAELNHVDEAFAEATTFYEAAVAEGGGGLAGGIILGDLNADCSFLSQTRYRQLDLVVEGAEFTWLIGNDADTTTRASDCAYDRFIVSGEIESFIVPDSAQTFRYDLAYSLTPRLTLEVSDHYPIEVLIQSSCLESVSVIAFTSGESDSTVRDSDHHAIEIKSNGQVRKVDFYNHIGINDMSERKGDMWKLDIAEFGFPDTCVRFEEIEGVAIVESSDDGWHIESVVTFVKNSKGVDQLLSQDLDANHWVEGGYKDNSRSRFDLHLVKEC